MRRQSQDGQDEQYERVQDQVVPDVMVGGVGSEELQKGGQ